MVIAMAWKPLVRIGAVTLVLVALLAAVVNRPTTPVTDAERDAAVAAEHAKNATTTARHDSIRAGALTLAVEERIRRAMRDPESADFRQVAIVTVGAHVTVCGEVNGKNGFGGFTGYQPFLGDSIGVVIRDRENAALFRTQWDARCLAR